MEAQKLTKPQQSNTDVQTDTGLNKIETLKERLEQQKATKIKAEQLVSTLSRIKQRERASRRSSRNTTEKKNEDTLNITPPPSTKKSTAQTNAQKEKSNLLKRKLEEERAKFESQREHEDLGRVSEIVEHLRVQLEDRDKTIQQIYTKVSTPKHVPLQHVEPQSNEPNVPKEIKQRIFDLEAKILDLQENLKEKDSVISARTQAITLLSEDMARKGKNTIDTLEETRSQMKEMQANFSTLEEHMNKERTRLKEELEDRKLKHQQAEKNFRAAEAARFTLSTRVAELQEKVVAIQTKSISLEEELNESNKTAKEMKEALDIANKQTITMKAQFKAKLKALEKERDTLKKDNDANAELNLLKERIADLEDEKGNLQLLLVDFDEIQETAKLLKERIGEMEEKLLRQENDLDNHVRVISMLEAQKLDLVEGEKDRSNLVKEQQDTIENLKNIISELEEAKVCAEMKCVELEEKMDIFIKENNETNSLQQELQSANCLLSEQQAAIGDLTQKLEDKQAEFVGLQNTPSNKNIQDLESDLLEWKLKYEDIELKLNSALGNCNEWEAKATSLQEQNQLLLQECEQFKSVILKFENTVTAPLQSDEENVIILKEELKKKESEINNIIEENKVKDSELIELQTKLQTTGLDLQRITLILEDMDDTNRKLEELNRVLEDRDKQLEDTTERLKKVQKKLSEYKKFHKLKSEDVLKVSQELETVSTLSQEKITNLENQLSKAQEVEENLRKELEQMKLSANQNKPDELTHKMKRLAASLKLKTKSIKEFDEKLTKMEKLLEEKQKIITELEDKNNEFHNILDSKQLELTEKESEISEQKRISSELNEVVKLLKTKSEEPENVDKTGTASQISQLEEENAKLHEALHGNYILIEQLNEDLLEARSMSNTLITQFDNMQKSYSDEEVKTKSILDQFGSEMLGNKKEIDNLVQKLSDSTCKYEQAWAKLQEKDAYIENLEQELEKVRSKMLQIQTALNERQEKFETTTEELGNRLQEAEIAKTTSQQYEDELEHKIENLILTETKLKTELEKIKFENIELQKSYFEVCESNKILLIELGEEKNRVKDLRKNLEELNERILKTGHTEQQVDALRSELKELRMKFENQTKHFEERERNNLFNFETEMQRLTEHIKLIESERNELAGDNKCLSVEKYNLNEEVQRLVEVINNENKLHTEKLNNVKIDFEKAQNIENENNLKEMNRILEEHSIHVENLKTSFMRSEQNYGINIQNLDTLNKELESELNELRHENSQIQLALNSSQQEILHLHELLAKEKSENDNLKIDLAKERTERQSQDVTTAEERVNVTSKMKPGEDNEMHFFKWSEEESGIRGDYPFNLHSTVEENFETKDPRSNELILDLENRLLASTCECERLELRVKELESRISASGEVKVGTDHEDWPINKDEEDGWGFTDAMLEAEHIQKQKANSDMIESRLKDLQTKLNESDNECSRLSEELRASQIKCGKLVKKAKEFKAKMDEMSKSKSVGFDDLDFAMQQELRDQIDNLEKSLKETKTELSSLKLEKENFIKRIDTLTSGNERLVDMKERQDIEVEMWKKRSSDLANQMQALEWRIQELMGEQNVLKEGGELTDDERQNFIQKAMEMEEKLNSIANENEYLLHVLGEARDQQKKQESSVHLNERIDDLLNENEKLNDELEVLRKVQSNMNNINNEIEKLKNENIKLNLIFDNLNSIISTEYKQTFDDSVDLSNKIIIIIEENKRSLLTESSLNTNINDLKREKEILNEVIRDLNDQLNEDKINFNNKLGNISANNQFEVERLVAENKKLANELEFLNTTFLNQASDVLSLQNELSNARLELENIKVKNVHQHQNVVESQPVLFRGFTDTTSSLDLIDASDNDGKVQALQEQVSALNRLLEDKENELETMKQYVECSNVGKENLQDELHDTVQQIHDENAATHNLDICEVNSLKENIASLNLLLKSKENELETMKQYVECSNVGKENLQDELHDTVQQIHDENAATHKLDICEVNSLKENIASLNLLLKSKDHQLDELKNTLEQMTIKEKELQLLAKYPENLVGHFSNQDIDIQNVNLVKENLNALNLQLQCKDNELDELKSYLEQMKISNEKMEQELLQKEMKIQQSNVHETTSFPGYSIVPEVPDIKYHRENEQLTEQVALLSRLLEEKDKEIDALKSEIKSSNLNVQNASVSVEESLKAHFEDPPAFRGFCNAGNTDEFFSIQKSTANIQTVESVPREESVFQKSEKHEMKSIKQDEQNKIEKYRKEIKILQNENSLLNKLLQEKETELELMKQQVECSKVEKENLQDELADRMLQKETFKEEDQKQLSSEVIDKLNKEISELSHLLQFKESSIQLLTQQNQQIIFENDGIVQKLKEEVEDYKLKSDSGRSEVEKMKAEVEDFKIAIVNDFDNKYQSQLTNLHNELSTKEQQLMNSVNDLHNIKKDNELLETNLKNFENKYEMLASENESLKEEFNLVSQQYTTVQTNTNKIQGDLVETIKSLEERLVKAENNYKEAVTELSEKQGIISEFEVKLEEYNLLQTEISVSKEKVNQLEEELSRIKNTREDSMNDLMLQLKTKEAEVENYKHERDEEKLTRSDLELPITNTISDEVLHYQELIKLRDTEILKLSQTLSDMQERLFRKEEGRLNSSGEDILRARLDEALYTLHLRDVRCDELTLELMQLLEERDTLQLRLSTAIRMNEELKGKHKPCEPAPSSENNAPPAIPVGSEDTNQYESFHQLNEKLGQLHNVGYRKDPAVQNDREKRHSEQMHLYSQHSTQEGESSSVFFNWIFGSSSASSSQDV